MNLAMRSCFFSLACLSGYFVYLCCFPDSGLAQKQQMNVSGSPQMLGKNLTRAEINSIQNKLNKNRYLTVDFQQEVFRAFRGKTKTVRGSAQFAKPHSFRWSLQDSNAKEWIYNGSKLTNFFPQKNFAVEYTATQVGIGKQIRQIADMVMNFEQLMQHYSVRSAQRTGSTVYIDLTPKRSSDLVKAELWINEQGNYVNAMKLYFSNNDTNTLKFHNPRKNPIHSSMFNVPSSVTRRVVN